MFNVCGLLLLMYCVTVVGRCRGFLMILVGFACAHVLSASWVFLSCTVSVLSSGLCSVCCLVVF